MTIEQWQKVKGVFLAAIELEAKERERFLRVTCRNDSRLLGEVESLLCSHQGAGDFIQKPVFVTASELFNLDNHADFSAGQRVARYEIEREIGRGGMGAVYLARDTSLGRRVTLKFIDSNFFEDAGTVRRFEREAYAASALNHPNILTVHELGEWNDTRFIAAEFVEGETLRQRLERDGRLSVAEALRIAAQIASALAAAHTAGIVHRDIKPENIMLRPDGLVKILDFGIAKLADNRASDFSNGATTQTGLIVGTPKYMSPEQARGFQVDSRADLWSLGCVLYEMVTGCAAFTGETTSDLIAAVLEREPVPCAEHIKIAPAELQRIISKALMKKADERYQTVAEIATDLQRLKRQLESGDEIPTVSDERDSATNDKYTSPKRSQELQRFFFTTARALALAVLLAAVAMLGYALFFRNLSVGNKSEIKSLAVLPFKSFAPEADDHLGIGIADTIIGKVSRIDGIIEGWT